MTKLEISKWDHKIKAANDYFRKWETKFKCKELEKYLEGFQNNYTGDENSPYVLNLFEATFAIKEPVLFFKRPIFYVDPQPLAHNSLPSAAYTWASNATDTLNTIAQLRDSNLADSISLALIDTVSYFGVVEVLFRTDTMKNPAAGQPILEENLDGELVDTGEVEPAEIPIKEWIEVKRIPAHRFRVGGNDCSSLLKSDWCGYYEFYSVETLRNGKYKNVSDIAYPGTRTDEFYTTYNEDENQLELKGDLVKVWKIWDNLKKHFFMMTDSTNTIIYEEDFDRLPLFDLRLKKRRKGWYPTPYSFSWKSPQDEINETREQIRSARRRAKRILTTKKGNIDEDELNKVEYGPDGTIALSNVDEPFRPVVYPPLDSAVSATLQISKEDFNLASGTSGEQRLENNRTTATQASIIDQRATIRDDSEKEKVADWLSRIGLEILHQCKNFTLDFPVKANHDLGGFFQDVQDVQEDWKLLTAEDLGNIDYSVTITVESLSPVANDQEKRKFMEFLAILSQYQLIAMHPDLIMEAAYRVGYKNLRIIKAFQQAAALQMAGQLAGAQQQTGNPNDNMAQQTTQQMTPPTQTEIQNQLDGQGVTQ